MNTAYYVVRLLDPNRTREYTDLMVACPVTTFLCKATNESEALELAETDYPNCEFLSVERIEYPE